MAPNPPPDVTVVIPVFNKARYLRDCLDSVLAQSLSTIEVICVDDASTDGSAAILETFERADSRVRLVRHAANRGPGGARNSGIGAATGRYLQFTDADDLLPPRALETLHRRISSDGVEMVRGTVATFSGASPEPTAIANPVRDQTRVDPLESEAFWVPWWLQCYMLSRRHVERHALRFPDLVAGEDPVFLASALVAATLVSATEQVTYHYREQAFAEKERDTFGHFQSYLRHAAMVREIFVAHRSRCWTDGYRPLVCRDLRSYLDVCATSDEQRRVASIEIDALCRS